MDAKHQFKYTYKEGCEDFSPIDITFEVPGDVSLQQMLYNFQSYLKAVGFVFDGELEIVDNTFDVMKDELDGTLYEFGEEGLPGGCMADFDKECGCLGDSITPTEYQKQRLKEWNEGIAKLDKEVKEQREIRENVSKRADELKQMEERWKKISNEEKASILADVLKASGL